VFSPASSWCGQISDELAYHGRQYYHSIWTVLPDLVRSTITTFAVQVELPGNPEQVQHQFLMQQWREIEKVLVEREAAA
jgi:hypothetical protein